MDCPAAPMRILPSRIVLIVSLAALVTVAHLVQATSEQARRSTPSRRSRSGSRWPSRSSAGSIVYMSRLIEGVLPDSAWAIEARPVLRGVVPIGLLAHLALSSRASTALLAALGRRSPARSSTPSRSNRQSAGSSS